MPAQEDSSGAPELDGAVIQQVVPSFQTSNVVRPPVPLRNLPGAVVDPSGTPCRFRLVDVTAFLDEDELRIAEYVVPDVEDSFTNISQPSIPPYAAISYPWRDLQLPEGQSVLSFSVTGAEHADPISMDVLRTACAAARAYGVEMLWLDRLCILQRKEYKEDKDWQIMRMFRIYKNCTHCLVIPGGLVRLARLDEPTAWIFRAWTLQEGAAPGLNKIRLIIQFTHSSYRAYLEERCAVEGYNEAFCHFLLSRPGAKLNHAEFLDKVLVEGCSATCDMNRLFHSIWGVAAALRYHSPAITYDHHRYPVCILSAHEAVMLKRAIASGGSQMQLWRAAYTRSSSRPVDMVFSLMDLLGVRIDVKRFDADDRLKATIAMIQELMKRPHARAQWLFLAPRMTPSRELSTLPEFPETSESGKAYIQTSKGRVLAFEAFEKGSSDSVGSSLSYDGAPAGVMDNSGYFVFHGLAAMLVDKTEVHRRFKPSDDRETWAVMVGRHKNLNRDPDTWKLRSWDSNAPKPKGLFELTLMFVEKHGYDLYHRVGMETEVDERKTTEWQWCYRRFQVGGPGRGERKKFTFSPAGPVYAHDIVPERENTVAMRIKT